MTGYIIRRLVSLLFVLWAVVTIVFFLMNAVPGGPFTLGERGYSEAAMQNVLAKYGLDKPSTSATSPIFPTSCVSTLATHSL